MAYSKTRRFMAGAVCPRCTELDKLVVYNQEGKDYRECVSCGFKDEMNFQSSKRELDTRVNQTEKEKAESLQVITIVPAKKI